MPPAQKKIAVIFPVYNAELFLHQSITSLFSQTYTNFDIFAVDDASTDKSLDILYKYKSDPRLFILKQNINKGVSAARNLALEIIENNGKTYDYIYFCDSDDIVSPELLETLVRSAVSESADIATCCYKRIDYPKSKEPLRRFGNYCSFGPESFVEQIFSLGKWRKLYGSGGQLFLRIFSAEKAKGIRFFDDHFFVEDELFCLEMATKVSKVTYIPQPLYLYRYRSTSLSQSKLFSKKLLASRIKGLSFSENITQYSLIVNICGIAQKSSSINDLSLLDENNIQRLLSLLKKGKKLKLISAREYFRFKFLATISKLKSKFNI